MNINAIIDRVFSNQNTRAIGSITKDQADFICQVISRQKPEIVVEVGVASGRSSAVMGLCLSEHGKGKLYGFDYGETYYDNKNLPVGFLIEETLSPLEKEHVSIYPKCTSFDAGKQLNGKKIDLAFIDANHQHPWPTLDSIALLPFLAEDAIILHHDLRLFSKPKFRHGVGPKFLYDNVPRNRIVLPAGFNSINRVTYNMFGVQYTNDYKQYVDELCDALLMPQTLAKKIDKDIINQITHFIEKYFFETRLVETWRNINSKL